MLKRVSIPFKRESIYAHLLIPRYFRQSEVSIPFKRESIYARTAHEIVSLSRGGVSIPFKRESIYALKMLNLKGIRTLFGFNSLQTGKHICTR